MSTIRPVEIACSQLYAVYFLGDRVSERRRQGSSQTEIVFCSVFFVIISSGGGNGTLHIKLKLPIRALHIRPMQIRRYRLLLIFPACLT